MLFVGRKVQKKIFEQISDKHASKAGAKIIENLLKTHIKNIRLGKWNQFLIAK